MSYTFELTFTGLCIFTFKGDKRSPSEVNVLMVKAFHHGTPHHRHVPFLTYKADNVQRRPNPPHKLVPLPDGSQIALQELKGLLPLELIPPASFTQAIKPVWRPSSSTLGKAPIPAQEDWLDWVMALQRMNPETPDPSSSDPFAGLKQADITARVLLKHGDLTAKNFRRDGANDYVTWDFKEPSGTVVQTEHAMAGTVLLSLPGIPDGDVVTLKSGSAFEVALQPTQRPDGSFETLCRASITNLPEIETPPMPPPPLYLEHFEHFYDPVTFTNPPSKLRLPHPHSGTITTTNTFCPPTTHTKAD